MSRSEGGEEAIRSEYEIQQDPHVQRVLKMKPVLINGHVRQESKATGRDGDQVREVHRVAIQRAEAAAPIRMERAEFQSRGGEVLVEDPDQGELAKDNHPCHEPTQTPRHELRVQTCPKLLVQLHDAESAETEGDEKGQERPASRLYGAKILRHHRGRHVSGMSR